jgi:hypothetical protein
MDKDVMLQVCSVLYRARGSRFAALAIVLATAHCTSADGGSRALGSANSNDLEPVARTSAPLQTVNDSLFVDGSAQIQGNVKILGPNPWVDVTAWGAVPVTGACSLSCAHSCGATDSWPAIYNALYTLSGSGGTLFFPAGTYCISQPIVVANPGYNEITLAGTGVSSQLMPYTGPLADGGTASSPPYLIWFSASLGGARDLLLQCNANVATAGLGLVPYPLNTTNTTIIANNNFSGLTIQGCSGASAIRLQAGANSSSFTNMNMFHDINISNGGYAYTGTGILLDNPIPNGSTLDLSGNHFFGVNLNGGTTYGINILAGYYNTFHGLNMLSGSTTNVHVASGAKYNQFFGMNFDNDADGSTDIVNDEPTTELLSANTYRTRMGGTAAGTMTVVGLLDGTTHVGPYAYSNASGVATLNSWGPSGSILVQADAGTTIQSNVVIASPYSLGVGLIRGPAPTSDPVLLTQNGYTLTYGEQQVVTASANEYPSRAGRAEANDTTSGATTKNIVPFSMPINTSLTARITVNARDTTAGKTAGFWRSALFTQDGTATDAPTLVGTSTDRSAIVQSPLSLSDTSVVVSTASNGTIVVACTGSSGYTFDWSVAIDFALTQ